MPVTVKVNGTSNSLVHKGSNHFAKNTIPDVCKTPSPGGPVPIPYPVIISLSSDLKNGTTTVKADGNSCAIKGSQFSRCSGDEPGTAGGVVSSTNMKEATWILYSFDVKMDGANACRLTDKMKMNHGNTVCLGGAGGPPVSVAEQVKKAKDALCKKLCNSNTTSSNKLEHACQNSRDPDFKKEFNVEFFHCVDTPRFKVKKTKPDAVLVNDKGERLQCFDFKRCGDRLRGTQAERQRAITKDGRPVVVISPETCGCPEKCK